MAEAILINELKLNVELTDTYIVKSAGISAFEGDLASQNAIDVLNTIWNLDLRAHRSKRISLKDIQDSWLILTMTRDHKRNLLSIFTDIDSKVFTLKEFVENTNEDNYTLDISDPYGRNLTSYKLCAEDIHNAIDKLVQKLKNKL